MIMDYEKLHKDTINRLQQMVGCGKITVETACGICADFVPESEDERIKKAVSQCVEDMRGQFEKLYSVHHKDAIAWLEKQDSYHTFGIIKGHWYKCVCDYMLNNSDLMFKNGKLYYCRSDWRLRGEIDERNVKDIGVNGYSSFFRPATNQEIKDWLEKQGEQKSIDDLTPQKAMDIAVSKCFEQGEQKSEEEVDNLHNYLYGEQKPAENKDYSAPLNIEIPFGAKDSELIQETIRIPDGCYAFIEGNEIVIKKGEKPVWSEEDELMLNDILMCGERHCYLDARNISWLKSLKDRCLPQSTQEWSERDEEEFQIAIDTLVEAGQNDSAHWLKSLKDRYAWKPSNEQIMALRWVLNHIPYGSRKEEISGLLEDLKKLREG